MGAEAMLGTNSRSVLKQAEISKEVFTKVAFGLKPAAFVDGLAESLIAVRDWCP